jgi:hypothetical protein
MQLLVCTHEVALETLVSPAEVLRQTVPVVVLVVVVVILW